MKVKHGKGKTKFGPGVSIKLTGNEVAAAIHTYLVAHGIHVFGPATVTVNGDLCVDGHVYVDPIGYVMSDGKRYTGRGEIEN